MTCVHCTSQLATGGTSTVGASLQEQGTDRQEELSVSSSPCSQTHQGHASQSAAATNGSIMTTFEDAKSWSRVNSHLEINNRVVTSGCSVSSAGPLQTRADKKNGAQVKVSFSLVQICVDQQQNIKSVNMHC